MDTSLNYQLRNDKKTHVPKFYTERFKNSYVIASCSGMNNRNSDQQISVSFNIYKLPIVSSYVLKVIAASRKASSNTNFNEVT